MLNQLTDRFKGERGMIAPASLAILVITALLAAATAQAAIQANSGSNRDRASKQAFAAAESGIKVATYRLNKTQVAADKCVSATVDVATGSLGALTIENPLNTDSDALRDWCAEQPRRSDDPARVGFERLEGSARFTYQVSTTYTDAATGRQLRKVVSVGEVGCDTPNGRCVRQRVTADLDPTAGRSDYALYGKKGIKISNDGQVSEGQTIDPTSRVCEAPGKTDPSSLPPMSDAYDYRRDEFCGAKIGTEGDLEIGGSSGVMVCGRARMTPGRRYTHTGANSLPSLPSVGKCLPTNITLGLTANGGGSNSQPGASSPFPANNRLVDSRNPLEPIVDRTTPPVAPPAPVLPGDADINRYIPKTGPGNLAPDGVPGQVDPTTGKPLDQWRKTNNSTIWDGKRLIVSGQNTTLTLRDASYAFCYLRVATNASIVVQPSDPSRSTYITIYSPGSTLPSGEVCPSNSGAAPDSVEGAKWGQVRFANGGKLINTTNNAGKLLLQVVGDDTDDDSVVVSGNFDWQKLPIFAPKSKVTVKEDAGVSAVIAEEAEISSNKGIRWDDRARDILPNAKSTMHYQVAWNECSVTPNAAAPATGC